MWISTFPANPLMSDTRDPRSQPWEHFHLKISSINFPLEGFPSRSVLIAWVGWGYVPQEKLRHAHRSGVGQTFLERLSKKSVILLPGVFFQAQCQQHCHYCLEISCLTCKNQGLRCQFIILGFPQLVGANFPFAGEIFKPNVIHFSFKPKVKRQTHVVSFKCQWI